MSNFICLDCEHKCYEYYANGTSTKAFYEWISKEEECEDDKRTTHNQV